MILALALIAAGLGLMVWEAATEKDGESEELEETPTH